MKRLLLILLAISLDCHAVELSVVTQNLHGYHPMNEAERWMEDRQGKREKVDSHLFYFTFDELDRGHRTRLDRLARDFASFSPDVILLQEVAAGGPEFSSKDCNDFKATTQGDRFETNSALRLQRRLQSLGRSYTLSLACRGNRGWITSPETFREKRVIRTRPDGSSEVVFDFGSNPYPTGILVEGLAILVRNSWTIQASWGWPILVPGSGQTFFAQAAVISQGQSSQAPWMLIVNVHAGHKVQHFEQAVALRAAIAQYLQSRQHPGEFLGTLIGGDFNAEFFRPASRTGEVSTVPWEMVRAGQFDYRGLSQENVRADHRSRLVQLNNDPKYKTWASIKDPQECRQRIDQAINQLGSLKPSPMVEALEQVTGARRCSTTGLPDAACTAKNRIDLLFSDPRIEPVTAAVIFQSNTWEGLDGVSDHPGVFARYRIR